MYVDLELSKVVGWSKDRRISNLWYTTVESQTLVDVRGKTKHKCPHLFLISFFREAYFETG
jgi:hypothetical protein